jgi:hypothetical protein
MGKAEAVPAEVRPLEALLLVIYLVLLALWIFVVYQCVKVATRKGRSPVLWGILGALFPVIALIVVYLLPPNGPEPVS